MKTLKIKSIKIACMLFGLTLPSFAAFSQDHVTMSVRNITATANTIEYDLYIVNDGTTSLKLSACSYGVNFDKLILNDGMLSYSYRENSRGQALSGLNPFSLANTKREETYQARMTSVPSKFENAPDLTLNHPYKIGRFTITNSANWTNNSNPNLMLQDVNKVALTTTQLVAYSGSSRKLVALTPTLNTVRLEVEKSPILNVHVDENTHAGNNMIRNDETEKKGSLKNPMLTNEQISLYPNPVVSELNIGMISAIEKRVIIQISDMSGHMVKQVQTNVIEGSNKITIDVSKLIIGVYTIKMNDDNEMKYSQTFVKQ